MMIVAAKKEDRQRLGELVVLCPKCGTRCKARCSTDSVTYYYCKADDCDGSVKIPRPSGDQQGRPRF